MGAVVTSIVAAAAGLNVLWRRRARRIRLEKYLREQRSDDTGEVLEAAFSSRRIKSWVATDGENGPDLEVRF